MRCAYQVARSAGLCAALLLTMPSLSPAQNTDVPEDIFKESIKAVRQAGRPIVLLHPRGPDTLVTHRVAAAIGAGVRGKDACGPQGNSCRPSVSGDTVAMRVLIRAITDTTANVLVQTWRKDYDASGNRTRGRIWMYTVELVRRNRNQWSVVRVRNGPIS
jgi:hypothetical protein